MTTLSQRRQPKQIKNSIKNKISTNIILVEPNLKQSKIEIDEIMKINNYSLSELI